MKKNLLPILSLLLAILRQVSLSRSAEIEIAQRPLTLMS